MLNSIADVRTGQAAVQALEGAPKKALSSTVAALARQVITQIVAIGDAIADFHTFDALVDALDRAPEHTLGGAVVTILRPLITSVLTVARAITYVVNVEAAQFTVVWADKLTLCLASLATIIS
jgi:hypothetical protein